MRDQSFGDMRETLGMKLAPLSIDVPISEISLPIPNRVRCQTRRKRRSRPATDRFHDLYEATGEVLGEGSHGAVHCFVNKQTKKEFAVKILSKSFDYDRSKILKEIDIFHHCQGHKNILQLNEYYEEDEKFYLVFDRLKGGSLFEHIQKRRHLSEKDASEIISNLASALDFLHHKGIAHRDLKPENILCENEDHLTPVRICDFDLGNAIILAQEANSPITTPELMTPVGSAEYMAPEVVDAWVGDASSYDKKCDLWSLGIILYIMLCGYPPFYAKCGDDCGWERGEACDLCQDMLFKRIQDGYYSFPEDDWGHISSNAKDLINHLLQRDPRKRYSAEKVLQHSWITTPPATSLLCRNNSSQMLLGTYAEKAMAIHRIMTANMPISETMSSSSNESPNALFSNLCDEFGGNSPKFFIGDMDISDDEEEGGIAIPGRRVHSVGLLKLSPPSSKLAERRKLRLHSVSLSPQCSPSL